MKKEGKKRIKEEENEWMARGHSQAKKQKDIKWDNQNWEAKLKKK